MKANLVLLRTGQCVYDVVCNHGNGDLITVVVLHLNRTTLTSLTFTYIAEILISFLAYSQSLCLSLSRSGTHSDGPLQD